MNTITTLLNDVGVLFTAISVLAITVTGFFLGRRWLRQIDYAESWDTPEAKAEIAADKADKAAGGTGWL